VLDVDEAFDALNFHHEDDGWEVETVLFVFGATLYNPAEVYEVPFAHTSLSVCSAPGGPERAERPTRVPLAPLADQVPATFLRKVAQTVSTSQTVAARGLGLGRGPSSRSAKVHIAARVLRPRALAELPESMPPGLRLRHGFREDRWGRAAVFQFLPGEGEGGTCRETIAHARGSFHQCDEQLFFTEVVVSGAVED